MRLSADKKEDDKPFRRLALILFAAALTASAIFTAAHRSAENGMPVIAEPAHGNESVPANSNEPTRPLNSPEPTDSEPEVPSAYAVLVNGTECALMESEFSARSVLDRILKEHSEKAESPPGQNGTAHSEFLEHISLRPVFDRDAARVLNSIEAYAALTSGEFAPQVKTTVSLSRTEDIAADPVQKIITDGSIPENTRLIVSMGRNGLKMTDSRIVYVNNKEVLRQDISETAILEPVGCEIRQGAAKLSDKKDLENTKVPDPGSLSFIKPVSGRIHMAYGPQKGQMHFGPDYECREGSEVVAPESGRVAAVTERQGLGLVIDIDHGNGFVSRFTNLKEAKVRYGETVTKGDVIALAGGILHYELRAGGPAVDPEKYFSD